MGRYIKYEIKGSYKFILGVLALVLILTTGIYIYTTNTDGGSPLGGIFIGLSVLVIFGTLLTTFLYIVGSFRKELYEDRGYLTFTLPLTGNQILGGKLIVAIIWFALLGIVIAGYNLILIMSCTPIEINVLELFSKIDITTEIIVGLLLMFISGISTLILIYFSMALSRVTFRNKRIGGFWFVIFLVLSGLIAYGNAKIIQLLPYYIDLDTFKIISHNPLRGGVTSLGIVQIDGTGLFASNGNVSILNIGGFMYNIIVGVLVFLGTGYIIENKIDRMPRTLVTSVMS